MTSFLDLPVIIFLNPKGDQKILLSMHAYVCVCLCGVWGWNGFTPAA